MKEIKYDEIIESRIVDINRMLNKLEGIFDIDDYKNDLENVIEKLNKLKNGKNIIDNNIYLEIVHELDTIKNRINEECLPFYEVYLLNYRIKDKVDDLNEDNYDSVKEEIVNLFNCLNKACTSQRKDCKKVLSDACDIIYKAIIGEMMIDKDSIIKIVRSNNNDVIKSNLGSIIRNILVSNLPQSDVVNIELDNLNKGIDYNYLSDEILEKVALATIGDKRKKYLDRKQSATATFLSNVDTIKEEQEQLAKDRKKRNGGIKNLRVKLAMAHIKAVALLMIPISTVYGLYKLGDSIREYKYNTSTRNMITNEMIGEETGKYIFQKDESYEIEIKKCSPWRVNENGGYIRDVVEYIYKDKNITEGINPEKLMESFSPEKIYTEKKDSLLDSDSTTESEILITETIKDVNDSRVAVIPTIGIEALALIVLFFIDAGASAFFALDDDVIIYIIEKIKDIVELGKEYRNGSENPVKITRKVIKERTELIGDKIVKLKEEYIDMNKKYGDLVSEVTPEQLQEVKRYIKKL